MKLTVTEEAASWYKDELDLEENQHVRFFVRYGFGGHIPGFSLGLMAEQPYEVHESTEAGNLIFYIEEKDAWYFDDKDLKVAYSNDNKEPEFIYEEGGV